MKYLTILIHWFVKKKCYVFILCWFTFAIYFKWFDFPVCGLWMNLSLSSLSLLCLFLHLHAGCPWRPGGYWEPPLGVTMGQPGSQSHAHRPRRFRSRAFYVCASGERCVLTRYGYCRHGVLVSGQAHKACACSLLCEMSDCEKYSMSDFKGTGWPFEGHSTLWQSVRSSTEHMEPEFCTKLIVHS